MTPVLFNFLLIHRRDGMHVQGVWLTCFIDPVGDYFISGQAFLWPPITSSPWGSRHIIVGANAGGNPCLSLSLCV